MRLNRITRTCAFCEQDYAATPSERRVYCSNACRLTAQRQVEVRTCPSCALPFERVRSRPDRHCSRECAARSTAKTLEEKFWPKVVKEDTERVAGLGPCWVWTGRIEKLGYGNLRHDGKTIKAHRAAWIIANGPIPDGKDILHACDYRACVRNDDRAHLSPGTHQQNMKERQVRGRTARGDRSGHRTKPESTKRGSQLAFSKLDEYKAAEILRLNAEGIWTHLMMAEHFGVSLSTIQGVIYRRTWKHVTLPPASSAA